MRLQVGSERTGSNDVAVNCRTQAKDLELS